MVQPVRMCSHKRVALGMDSCGKGCTVAVPIGWKEELLPVIRAGRALIESDTMIHECATIIDKGFRFEELTPKSMHKQNLWPFPEK